MNRGWSGPLHRLPIHATAERPEERVACVGPARAVFRSVASGWGITDPILDDVVTVVSELVANAARHSRPGILHTALRLRPAGDRVRFEVHDHSHRMPRPAAGFDDQAVTGRGLLMVAVLADRWGATPTVTGKTVWAEIALPIPLDVPALELANRRAAAVTDLVAASRLRMVPRPPVLIGHGA